MALLVRRPGRRRGARASSILAVGLVAAMLGCAASPHEGGAPRTATAPAALRGLTNADVAWDGNPAGYWPWFTGAAAARVAEIRAAGPAAIPGLIEALSDPDRFVAAHVLLTQLASTAYEAFPTWNGLVIELRSDGRAVIDPGQRFILEQRWRRWARELPPPRAPPATGAASGTRR